MKSVYNVSPRAGELPVYPLELKWYYKPFLLLADMGTDV